MNKPVKVAAKNFKFTNRFSAIKNEEAEIRAENMKEAYRREDGVLQLPTRTCEGFGFDVKIDLAT